MSWEPRIGRIQCLFYQFAGTSQSGLSWDGSSHNWRCIPVEDMEDVNVIDGSWHSADDYSADDQTCVDVVIESV